MLSYRSGAFPLFDLDDTLLSFGFLEGDDVVVDACLGVLVSLLFGVVMMEFRTPEVLTILARPMRYDQIEDLQNMLRAFFAGILLHGGLPTFASHL